MLGSKTDRPVFKTFCVIFICIYQLFPIDICIAFHLNKYFDFSLLLVFLQVKLNPSCLRPFCQFIQPPYSMSALGGLCLLIGHMESLKNIWILIAFDSPPDIVEKAQTKDGHCGISSSCHRRGCTTVRFPNLCFW